LAIITGTVLRTDLEQLRGLRPGRRLKELGLNYRLTGQSFERAVADTN
jgi:hypothetical protein